MPSARLIATLAVPLAGAAVLTGLWRVWDAPAAGFGETKVQHPEAASAGPTATASPAPGAGSAAGAATASGTASTSGAARADENTATSSPEIMAAAVVRRFCDLVDRGRWRASRHLLAGPWVWSAGDLREVTRLVFLAATAHRRSLVDDLVFFVQCSMRRSTPRALHRDVTTLVFTLGRGGTGGGWLITAVSPRS